MPHGPRFTHRTHAIFRRCTAPSSMASDPENRSLLGYYGRTATALPLIARRAWDDHDRRRCRHHHHHRCVRLCWAAYVEVPAAVGTLGPDPAVNPPGAPHGSRLPAFSPATPFVLYPLPPRITSRRRGTGGARVSDARARWFLRISVGFLHCERRQQSTWTP